jgi:hypothetical protein
MISQLQHGKSSFDNSPKHGLQDSATDVTGDDPFVTGSISLAQLNEFADCFSRLEKIAREAEAELG